MGGALLAVGALPLSLAVPPSHADAGGNGSRSAATATPDGPRSRTALVDGAVGAQIKVACWLVTLPPGAFDGAAKVSVVVSGNGNRVVSLDLDPDSKNHFAVPAQLQYTRLGSSENVSAEAIYWWDPVQGEWTPVADQSADPANGTLSAKLHHFSVYCVGGKAGW